MSNIEIEGVKYKVVERLGYNPDIGLRCFVVNDSGYERKAVKDGKVYRFWTIADRMEPYIQALRRQTEDLKNRGLI